MELSTTGVKNYLGYQVPLFVDNNEKFLPGRGMNSRFCLTFVEEGAGVMRLNKDRMIVTSPSLYCFNETDERSLEQDMGIKARSVYFHPSVINSIFDFNNIYERDQFSGGLREDADWLEPFVVRLPNYKGQLLIGIGTSKRIEQLYEKLEEELENQDDWHWPCRSRSFFFEILITMYKLYLNPQIMEDTLLTGEKKDIEDVLLYLNMNYMNRITIESLEDIFHINRTSMNEKFTALTGEPIKKYLIRLRIRIACMLLRDTLLPVAEIMERVGYNNANNFNRAFGKLSGVTPSEYRNSNCWMKESE